MTTVLTETAMEQGTYIVTVAFTDEAGAAVVPNAGLNWTLTDLAGNVINSRNAVVISPASSISIILHGDDLAVTTADTLRLITVQGTYDSSLGVDLELKAAAQFKIEQLVAVS